MRGYFWDIILLLGLLIIQTVILGSMPVKMDFTFLVIIRVAFYASLLPGIFFVLIAGWLMDVFSGNSCGMFMLIYPLLFLLIKKIDRHVDMDSFFIESLFALIAGILETVLIISIISFFYNSFSLSIMHVSFFIIQLIIFSMAAPFFIKQQLDKSSTKTYVVQR